MSASDGQETTLDERVGRARNGGARRRARRPLVMLGPLRVLGVRVLVAPEGSVIEAVGVLHRRPVTQRVSAATAAELVSRGASLVLRQPSGDGGRPGQGRPATVPEGR